MPSIRYFPPHPPVASKGLSIKSIGIREPMQNGIVDRPAGTGDYLFMFYYDPVILQVGGETAWWDAETLIVWRPEDGHYYGHPDLKWLHSWIHCDGTWIGKWLAENEIPMGQAIAFPFPSDVERTLLDIYEEIHEQDPPDAIILGNFLQNWIRRIARHLRQPERKSTVPQRFRQAKRYLDENFTRKIRLGDLASMAHCSVPHFCSEFKKHFGISAIAYLTRQRLHTAAYLLRNENLRVSEIGRMVGYEDIYYFSKHFKKHYGRPPSHMRRR